MQEVRVGWAGKGDNKDSPPPPPSLHLSRLWLLLPPSLSIHLRGGRGRADSNPWTPLTQQVVVAVGPIGALERPIIVPKRKRVAVLNVNCRDICLCIQQLVLWAAGERGAEGGAWGEGGRGGGMG